MTHLELENLVSDYLEGQLETARRTEVDRHLAGCLECREMVADVERVLGLCRSAEPLEPPPWMLPKIVRATLGERKPGFIERYSASFRAIFHARVVYSVAMTVFSLSVMISACGVDVRHLRVEDLNPRTWVYQADRGGHLMLGRIEKYYYDLKVVYEIESRLRQFRSTPATETPRPQAPAGGTTQGLPASEPSLAMNVATPVRESSTGGWLEPANISDRLERSTSHDLH